MRSLLLVCIQRVEAVTHHTARLIKVIFFPMREFPTLKKGKLCMLLPKLLKIYTLKILGDHPAKRCDCSFEMFWLQLLIVRKK